MRGMGLPIRGFTETSFVDLEGKILSVVFIGGCNLRCPYCHNPELVQDLDDLSIVPNEVIDRCLVQHKDFIDGVCISGGEPLLYEEILNYLRHFKGLGLLVKLDTNGTLPHMLEGIIDQGLVDYIAMDLKAPLRYEDYSRSSGTINKRLFEGVVRSVKILMEGKVDYEFRTTIVPTIHTERDIEEIADYIKGARRFVLQNFRPIKTLDPRYKYIKPYPIEEIKKIGELVSGYVKEVLIRGN